jgi:hypothetical protein
MCETFKINVYFDEKGEELESLIERLLIDILEKKQHKIFIISTF